MQSQLVEMDTSTRDREKGLTGIGDRLGNDSLGMLNESKRRSIERAKEERRIVPKLFRCR